MPEWGPYISKVVNRSSAWEDVRQAVHLCLFARYHGLSQKKRLLLSIYHGKGFLEVSERLNVGKFFVTARISESL